MILNRNSSNIEEYIQLERKIWKHIFTTNCYAFALGLDKREESICSCAYIPGNMGDSESKIQFKHFFSYSDLVKNIFDDLDFLKIAVRRINPREQIDDDSWKIALFTRFLAYEDYIEYISDFHFLRELSDGTWMHKEGWWKYPTCRDSKRVKIVSPDSCYIKNFDYRMTLKLRKK